MNFLSKSSPLLKTKYIAIGNALRLIKSRQTIVTAMAAAEPSLFYKHIHEVAQSLQDVKIFCANPVAEYECFSTSTFGHLEFRVLFLSSPVRGNQGQGILHYVPQHLSQWTSNILSNHDIDIFWGSCSLPDERGFVSLGVGACYEPEIIRKAKLVILEVNERMPITFGATTFPISKVDLFIENHHNLPIIKAEISDETDEKIAGFVSELIPDQATLQLGIGAIPNAVGKALRHRKGLGVHTELINDAIMELSKGAIVTNEHKSIWPNKSVGAFVYGSQDLYDFVHMNAAVELQPASVVNDPYRIGRNHRMVSVNTAVEIDITGQVCSESLGHQELSGVGGAFDTHTGAQRSEGGRGIIALRSMTKTEIPKIVFELKAGAKVSVSRNDVDTIVTEFGIAKLRGKTVSERVQLLASIAHPSTRSELLRKAKEACYI